MLTKSTEFQNLSVGKVLFLILMQVFIFLGLNKDVVRGLLTSPTTLMAPGAISMTIYLYKKTHNKTGLKYLGKTTKDPFDYQGSGKDWKPHLKEHGYDVTTEILKECHSNEELSYWGRYYSALWNVVESNEWANRIPESGGGVGNGGGDRASEIATKMNKQRVENGTHPWLNREQQRIRAARRVEAKACSFAGDSGSKLSKRVQLTRVENRTHHLLGGEIQRKTNAKRVEDGTHHFLGGAIQRKMVEDGTHPFLSGEISKRTQRSRIENGTHHFLQPITETHPTQARWKCDHCGIEGKGKANYSRWHGSKCKTKPN